MPPMQALTSYGGAPICSTDRMRSLREEKVGVIGAGALGKAIAGHFSRRSIRCVICNSRAPATLEKIVQTWGPTIRATTLEEAVMPEIVILAIPCARVPEMMERVPDWEGRIVIDATNPSRTRYTNPERGALSYSERIVGLAPGAHVVMAFNTLPATILTLPPEEAGGKRVLFYSGDHRRAKRKVAALISCMGFAAVDLGALAMGDRLQRSPGGALAMLNLVHLSATSSSASESR
jgi:8-hydroxy-5-deazaflavin:NADPH oxidoreductase